MRITFRRDDLTSSERLLVSRGFQVHAEEQGAPEYKKERISWLAFEDSNDIQATLTADILWDWVYVDQLWVST